MRVLHRRLIEILPVSMTSAINSTGTCTGSHVKSARTMKRTLSSAASTLLSRSMCSGRRGQPRLVSHDRRLDFLGNIADRPLVDGAVGNVGKPEIQDRFADIGRVRSGRCVEFHRDGIEQRFEVARNLAPQHRLR